jgi:aryl-alcohol dehydrogenase-like predicted oxidoreductase
MPLILGTAMWGWTTSPAMAMTLLDQFYAAGGRAVDTATNYPINKNPGDFRQAERLLADWIRAHGINDLALTVKVGSINNLRTPDNNLSKSFLLLNLDQYEALFGSNLRTFMLHWDNRDDEAGIRETLEALALAAARGLQPGLSGIRFPEIYHRLNQAADLGLDFSIQIKHNLLQSDYSRYHYFHGQRCFVAYGINAGGVKLNPADYGPAASLIARGGQAAQPLPLLDELQQWLVGKAAGERRVLPGNMNQLGMLYACYQPDMAAIVIGPSSPGQLAETLAWATALQHTDYSDLYRELVEMAQ